MKRALWRPQPPEGSQRAWKKLKTSDYHASHGHKWIVRAPGPQQRVRVWWGPFSSLAAVFVQFQTFLVARIYVLCGEACLRGLGTVDRTGAAFLSCELATAGQ